MRKALRNNGLSLVLLVLFLVFFAGQAVSGHRRDAEERLRHGRSPVSFGAYLAGPEFLEATFENWESEFLQMGLFVILTALLYQKGSSESKPLPEEKGRPRRNPSAARVRGWKQTAYEHSLSAALLGLFALSFAGHAVAGSRAYNALQAEHGAEPVGVLGYMGTSQFWFESFQNWQSEFLSVGVIIVLSIFLRERGSSQSKEVDAPHGQTGT